jgi:general secretion pathway protein D
VRVFSAASALAFALSAIVCAAPAEAAIVSALRVDLTTSGATRVIIGFNGPPPVYRILGSGSAELTIQMSQAQLGPNVPTNLQGVGSVVGVRFAVSGAVGSVAIRLAAPVPVRVTSDARNIYVDVAPAPAAAMQTPRPLAAPSSTAVPPVIEVIPLKYADVSEIVGILVEGQSIPTNDNFAPQPSQLAQPGNSFGGSAFPVGGPQQAAGAAFGGVQQSLGQRITERIAIDRRLNAIILSGTPDEVAAMRATIDKIDVPLPSVLLETEIVELTDTAAKAVGIDFSNGGPLATAQTQIRSFNPPTTSINLQAAIYDVVSRGGGKLLARPRVVAQNGAPATILTGDAIPIITNITSFGSATVTQQQVQYVSVGVNLQIQPRISSDGYVTSHVFSEVSSVTGYVQSFPQISQRVATTSATVRDGESFVIGGLVSENELHSLDRVPGLGSLPIIGGLFRNRHESFVATNLYIVVTPHVVHTTPR